MNSKCPYPFGLEVEAAHRRRTLIVVDAAMDLDWGLLSAESQPPTQRKPASRKVPNPVKQTKQQKAKKAQKKMRQTKRRQAKRRTPITNIPKAPPCLKDRHVAIGHRRHPIYVCTIEF